MAQYELVRFPSPFTSEYPPTFHRIYDESDWWSVYFDVLELGGGEHPSFYPMYKVDVHDQEDAARREIKVLESYGGQVREIVWYYTRPDPECLTYEDAVELGRAFIEMTRSPNEHVPTYTQFVN